MRVLHVTPAYHPARVYGGPIRSVHGLTRALARAGTDVRVLTTNANGLRRVVGEDTRTEHEVEANLRVRYAERLAFHSVSPALVARLGEYVRWADVVHLTGVYSFPTIPTLVAVRAARKPLVWSPRGSLQRWEHTRRRAAKVAWELACRLLLTEHAVLHATSDDEARQAEDRISGLRCVVIPNGVDVPERVSHEESEEFRVLFLGRLDPIKAIENLLEACARLPNGVQLTLAGTGPPDYDARLRARAAELQLGDRARFVGEVGDELKQDLFSKTDVLVLPSFSENFGLVVAEALAHGVPAVASRGTPWQALQEAGLGKWVDNGPDSLARSLSELRAADLRAMGDRGRAWVAKELGWPAVAARMLALYRELLGVG
ncbi:MAG: glycosyltransferase [Myxococcales bacterium]|nr:glycosyltransferase [Myxococcales bacterium]